MTILVWVAGTIVSGLIGLVISLVFGDGNWAQFHDPKNLAMAVASEAGELLAEYRWIRGEESDRHSAGDARPRIADEAADVGVALLLFCERVGLDLVEEMYRKLEKNREKYPADLSRSRPDPPERAHGK